MKYRHALCLYPYVRDQSPGIGIFPPTGLEYIATALKGHVGRISLVDLRHERAFQPIEKLRRFIHEEGVDLICVSLSWQARYSKICDYITQLPSDIMTVVGGREVTANVEDVFTRCPNVDLIVRGEGEETIVEIARERPLEQILGLSYRKEESVVHNPNRPLPAIDRIAPPDRSLRRSRYFPVLRGLRLFSVEFDTILSSRGCPYKCKFCTFNLNPLGQKREYEARSPESVVEEIATSPARVIQFADDNFFVKPSRAEKICDLLTERGINKIYCANARMEISKNPQMLEKAYKAGFRVLLLGIESASDRILKQLDKGFTTQQVREAFKVLRQFPFWYHGYFMYGNIGETEEEMLAIPEFARELGVHAIGLSQLRMDKYTPLRQVVENTPGYWISENGHVYSKEFDKKKLLTIRNKIRNRFLYRPGQMAKIFSALKRTEIFSAGDFLRLGMVLPWMGYDYISKRSKKSLKHLRERFG
jgi:anaerobic magnesium-protoporphyrin IX monomethyl ester cyclase